MNPNTTIKPWLIICGKQMGINEVHEYRWHDADNKNDEPYIVYQELNSDDEQEGDIHDLSSRSGDNTASMFAEPWLSTVQIDLYNSQNGINELAALVSSIYHDTIRPYMRHLSLYSEDVTDLTTWDDERINYHHRLECQFRENVAHELTETNQAVQVVELELYNGHNQETINIY